MLKQRYELFVNCGSFVARFSSLFVLVFHSKCDKVCGYQCVMREIAGQIKTEKSFSQHHNKPLKISGLFLFVTVFGTQWCREHQNFIGNMFPLSSYFQNKWCCWESNRKVELLWTSAPQGGERPMGKCNRDFDYKNGAIYTGTICKAPSLHRSLVYIR